MGRKVYSSFYSTGTTCGNDALSPIGIAVLPRRCRPFPGFIFPENDHDTCSGTSELIWNLIISYCLFSGIQSAWNLFRNAQVSGVRCQVVGCRLQVADPIRSYDLGISTCHRPPFSEVLAEQLGFFSKD